MDLVLNDGDFYKINEVLWDPRKKGRGEGRGGEGKRRREKEKELEGEEQISQLMVMYRK